MRVSPHWKTLGQGRRRGTGADVIEFGEPFCLGRAGGDSEMSCGERERSFIMLPGRLMI